MHQNYTQYLPVFNYEYQSYDVQDICIQRKKLENSDCLVGVWLKYENSLEIQEKCQLVLYTDNEVTVQIHFRVHGIEFHLLLKWKMRQVMYIPDEHIILNGDVAENKYCLYMITGQQKIDGRIKGSSDCSAFTGTTVERRVKQTVWHSTDSSSTYQNILSLIAIYTKIHKNTFNLSFI